MEEVALLPAGTVYLDRTRPLGSQIVDDLKTRMLSGQYPQGVPLPSPTALGEFYDVTDQVIHDALRRLVKANWLIKAGYGKYRVATIIPPIKQVKRREPVSSQPSTQPDLATLAAAPEEMPPVPASPAATRYLCTCCGIWAELPCLPAEVTLTCTACQRPMLCLDLDPAKRVGECAG